MPPRQPTASPSSGPSPTAPAAPRRRSYDQYCAVARSLDAVGDRWSLLIVRELLAGPRRYTDLHADLPGVSTDVLASRLKDLEREGLATRRRLPPPTAAHVYELTPRGAELLPVLTALAAWGVPELAEPRPTDAVRAHWYAVPLLALLDPLGVPGVLDVTLEDGVFHLRLGARDAARYGDGPAAGADAGLALSAATCRELTAGRLTLADGVRDGLVTVAGEGPLAAALRAAG
ncbi:winged helix-turn-helix transcriptional regulator [Streptomyces sp. NPDC060194]|uniref:winged helix-turn-helix transcriptional regulator n=1 Tax=Streptomyces sp. NPDC060194 TaxID=3347069 RepID=UPI00364DD409